MNRVPLGKRRLDVPLSLLGEVHAEEAVEGDRAPEIGRDDADRVQVGHVSHPSSLRHTRRVQAPRLTPVGVVRSPLGNRADAPRQGGEGAPDALIVIESSFAAALEGVQAGDELLVLTWLHEADRTTLQVHPRDDDTRPLTGVFATRSSDRPNPIGIHRVTVHAVDELRLDVGPLEAIDGTPVVDLKPVLRGER